MKKVKITEVCEIQVGKTPSRSNPSYWGNGSLWLSIADMNQGPNFDKTKETITEKAIRECNCKIVPKNTVLFSFKLSIGKVGITKVPMYTNEAIAAFIVKDDSKLDTKFLSYVLKSADYSVGSNKAVMGKTLNKEQLKKIEIPLPSLEEQESIVKMLDKADSLCRKRKQAAKLLDEYLKSVFLEMFGNPQINPKNIRKVKISDMGQVVTGNTPPRNQPLNYGGKTEWIKSDNINNDNDYLTTATEFLSERGEKIGRVVPSGSVLVTCIAGSLSCIGNVGMANREVAFNQQINAIVPDKDMTQPFLYSQILYGKDIFRKASTNSMKGMLSKGKFSEIELMKPDIDSQKKYTGIFLKTQLIKQKILTQSLNLNNLFQVLMQKSFMVD